MTEAFTLGVPDDLILPEKGSMTARALVSYAQRSLFEKRASLLVPGLDGTPEHRAIVSWLEIVAGMLPGKPHAVARALRDPAVHLPARRLLTREGDTKRTARAFAISALLWLELEDALPRSIDLAFEARGFALGHGVRTLGTVSRLGSGTTCERLPAVEGKLVALSGELPWLGLRGKHIDDARIIALRAALAVVARAAPALRDDLDRLVSGFVVGTRPTTPLPVGVVFVPQSGDVRADARAIVDAVVLEKLALVRLADTIAEPFEPLRTLALEHARARVLGEASASSAREVRARVTCTEIGEGILSELARAEAQKRERSP